VEKHYFAPKGKKMCEEILKQMQELLKYEAQNFAGNFGQTETAFMNLIMTLCNRNCFWLV